MSNTSQPTLADLEQRRAKLQRDHDDHVLWLERIAARFSSSEEQQRIMFDITCAREELRRVDHQIERLGAGGE